MDLGKRPNWASDIIKIVGFGEGFVVFGSIGNDSWTVKIFVMGEPGPRLTMTPPNVSPRFGLWSVIIQHFLSKSQKIFCPDSSTQLRLWFHNR